MNLAEFESILQERGQYDTPAHGHRSLLALPLVRWFWFYLRVLYVNYSAAKDTQYDDYFPARWQLDSFRLLTPIESIGGRLSLHGVQHLGAIDSSAVIIGNHMSSLETMILPCIVLSMVNEATYIVKRELMDYPWLGTTLRKVQVIDIGRSNPKVDLKRVLDKGAEMLQRGCSIMVFPQQTRTAALDYKEFSSLGIKLAKRAGKQVVPLALKTDLWKPGRWIKDLGAIDPRQTVRVEFGEPFYVQGQGKEEHDRVFRFIESRLAQWYGRPETVPTIDDGAGAGAGIRDGNRII